mgnify:CR=1 FL=1
MKKIISILILALFVQLLNAHPWKPSHYVIIDTDAGLDDLKTINMLLASPDIRVLAITVSGGVMPAESAYIKVRSLLNSYHHQGIKVGVNRGSPSKDFNIPSAYTWADKNGIITGGSADAIEIISGAVTHEKTPVSFVALGSMNVLDKLHREQPGIFDKLKEILWSNESAKPLSGFNYELDSLAARKIITTDIPTRIIGYDLNFFYDDELVSDISELNTPYAKSTARLFSEKGDHNFIRGLTDDMIALYLHYPEIFETTNHEGINYLRAYSSKIKNSMICSILSGKTVNRNQVFKDIPVDTSFYFPDLQPYIDTIITRHGREEWEAGVLANEMHRHFGIYAIIGVKMGIRAREYYNTGVDEMIVESHAGSSPPVSCLNDGLQLSTGATVGHGLIKVVNDNIYPEAYFLYKNNKLHIRLKKDIADKIRNELKEINYVYGLDSNIYWELVRQKAILYWKNLDRHKIFDVTEE